MTNKFTLSKQLQGRDIFSRVIPTVNTLKNLFKKLDKLEWDYSQLKNWEKPIFNTYSLDNIKAHLKKSDEVDRVRTIKSHLLNIDPHTLGPHPICIYLIAYFLQSTKTKDLNNFKKYVIDNGISTNVGSATAIWHVGTNDGKFLGLFDDQLNIKDFDFFEKWSKDEVKEPVSVTAAQVEEEIVQDLNTSANPLQFFLSLKENTK